MAGVLHHRARAAGVFHAQLLAKHRGVMRGLSRSQKPSAQSVEPNALEVHGLLGKRSGAVLAGDVVHFGVEDKPYCGEEKVQQPEVWRSCLDGSRRHLSIHFTTLPLTCCFPRPPWNTQVMLYRSTKKFSRQGGLVVHLS